MTLRDSNAGQAVRYLWKRWNSTVINSIWPELWFFTTFAVVVCVVNLYGGFKFQIPNGLLTVLGTVLGLVISFRTTSAYDRYWEGRKLWGNIALQSRNMAMIIWIQVPLKRKGKEGEPTPADTQLRAIIERKTMINLVQAYSVAVKHFLRSEPGVFYEDLFPLLSFLPNNVDGGAGPQTNADRTPPLPMWNRSGRTPAPSIHGMGTHRRRTFNPEAVLPQIQSDIPLRRARAPPKKTIYDIFPPLIIFVPIHVLVKWMFGRHHNEVEGSRDIFGKKKQPEALDSNVPLEITLFLSSYLQMLIAQNLLSPAIITAYNNALVGLQDAVINLERIRTTPIPFAYQAHLRASIWLYLLFLPLQIYSTFKWLTVPGTIFVTFLYLGFLEIGQEIENPFNYDENDLDLDGFCLQIQRELAEITAHPAPEPSSYIFSHFNQPFAPAIRNSAAHLLHSHAEERRHDEDAVANIKVKLLENYRTVSAATQRHKAQKDRLSDDSDESGTDVKADEKV